jgi:hypothetical protein
MMGWTPTARNRAVPPYPPMFQYGPTRQVVVHVFGRELCFVDYSCAEKFISTLYHP